MDQKEKKKGLPVNVLLIGGAALVALVLLAVTLLLPGTESDVDCVVIVLGDEEYRRVPLSEPGIVTIEQKNGAVNVIEVSESGMRMVSSTCANQICVRQGWVTLDTWEMLGSPVISCLPNRVILELVEAQEPAE